MESDKRKGGRHGARRREVKLSKALSYILRHAALELGLGIRKDGYILVSDIL